MKEFAVTMMNEDGAYINLSADRYEIAYDLNDKPEIIFFVKGDDIICHIDYHFIYELAEIKDEEYIKLDLPK